MINIALSERKQGIKNCVQRDQRQNKDLNQWGFLKIFNNFSLARRAGQLGATAQAHAKTMHSAARLHPSY